ncbi:hypothetical protein GCM10009530_12070 [Microbispora corallina]|uniref:Uncharacterized protein n=1 Tax=Microbispora corallina TaxID=83302 RepID=A0ABQ4FTE8_9ACTN|nr:hypothetical protein [Microbispora corallina]GIH38096.1 hypothetical protein Mco01_10960 [Microbispora corallina]
MAHLLSALIRTGTSRPRRVRALVTFNEATGEVCDATCRSDAHLDRARTAALAVGLGRI